MNIVMTHLISFGMSLLALVLRVILFPTSYNYHSLLNRFIAILSRKHVDRCIALFAINSINQFSDGSVYKYKKVVSWSDGALHVDTSLAQERIKDIFLKESVLSYLQVSGTESLLEVGCEAGQNLSVIGQVMPFMKLSGCDVSINALSRAEFSGIAVRNVNLLEVNSLSVYEDGEFDYVLISHVFEHLVASNFNASYSIRRNILWHLNRIARRGYIITAQIVAQSPVPPVLSFIGHARVALPIFSVADLDEVGVGGFYVISNRIDGSVSIVVRKD